MSNGRLVTSKDILSKTDVSYFFQAPHVSTHTRSNMVGLWKKIIF